MKSACGYGEEQLAGLLYEDGDTAELRAHLATCAECRAELEELTATRDLLSAWPNAVNAPRMVYVNEQPGLVDRLRRWANDFATITTRAAVRPALAAAAMVLVVAVSFAVLDVRVAPDGRVQIGFAGAAQTADPIGNATAADTPISRDEFQEGLTQAVAYLEDLVRARSDEDRMLLMVAIDERMQEQGLAMDQRVGGALNTALADIEQQYESDLGLVFSAIDELGLMTADELQRMNMILASLVREPGEEE